MRLAQFAWRAPFLVQRETGMVDVEKKKIFL
jgi:hypothetical protein